MNSMKTIFLALATAFVLFSCSPKTTGNKGIIPENANELASENLPFAVDSLHLEDSIAVAKTLKLRTSSTILLFPTIHNKTLLDSIYSPSGIKLETYSKEKLQKELVNQKEAYFSQGQENFLEFQSGYEQTWEENSYMKVFSNQNDILTISYENDGFSGGAHGYYNILFKNFDLKNNKTIQLSDVFMDINKVDWNKILMKNFKNPDQKEMLLVDKIPVNNNFYFDSQNITFVYNQYEITAYAAGVVEISIPFSVLKPYLKPEFISRNNIK